MNSIKRVALLAVIAIVFVAMLSFCAPDIPDGTVIGKGHEFETDAYYLILEIPGEESAAVQVTEAEYNSYNTGDYYGDK